MRSEGGGFAASIYGAMPKGLQWQVFRVSPAFPVSSSRAQPRDLSRETLIQSLSDFTLESLCIARNNLTRIASYLRKGMTKLCIKILVKSDSAIESAFPLHCGQYHISTGRERCLVGTCFCIHIGVVCRSARKISRCARNDDAGV